ncbi:MAG: glycosyltransferase family A protein, partial [Parvularculaceae bacterium]
MTVSIGYVAIGRNEGERLAACLASLRKAGPGVVVYVDSGSTDDSLAIAKSFEAEIVALDMSTPFTAARARNAGISRLFEKSDPEFVQVIDGDCELRDGWSAAAAAFLGDNADGAGVGGRRRER